MFLVNFMVSVFWIASSDYNPKPEPHPDGKEDWVNFSYLSQTIGQATAERDYSAQELTIAAVEYLRSGLCVRNAALYGQFAGCRPKERVRNYQEA